MTPGTYAYRFSGYAMDTNGTPYRLVGVGKLNFFKDGTLSGQQSSAVTELQGFDHKVQPAVYELSGTHNPGNGLIGEANVTFLSPMQILKSTFAFVEAGPDRLWLISTGSTRTTSGGEPLPSSVPADELVTGEAVRVGDLA
jgi:hypothetical protein